MAQSPAVNIGILSIEMHLEIINYLDYPSSVALSQVSRYFRSTVSVRPPVTPQQKLLFLRGVEMWPK
jgi:hypothetical protein